MEDLLSAMVDDGDMPAEQALFRREKVTPEDLIESTIGGKKKKKQK